VTAVHRAYTKPPSEEIYTSNQRKKQCSTFSGFQRCRWQYGSIFIRLAVVASQVCKIQLKFFENSNL